MATVYLAIQESFEREVALKIMSPELAEEQDFSERFLREARIVSKLVHPNIVTVHDVGIENGHHYLSMQYIDGKDLKRRLPDMSAQEIFRALKEVAMALNYAGGKGYVHRDVKPDNIMLNGEDGRAILMDFGIARASRPDNSMTRTGTALGTPHYMSPEQARGAEVDGRSDIYSLGVLFYYLLVGKVPFEADSPVAVGIKHLTEPVPTLPAPLSVYQPLVNKLMAKKPEQRYQTGKDVCEAFEQLPVKPLDDWHNRKEFEFKSDGSDTPVRTTVTMNFDTVNDTDATVVTPAVSRSGTANRRTSGTRPSAGVTSPGESLHIPREDLAGRSQQRKSRSLFPLLVLVVGIAIAGAYFAYPAEFMRQWQRVLVWVDQQTGEQFHLVAPEPPGEELVAESLPAATVGDPVAERENDTANAAVEGRSQAQAVAESSGVADERAVLVEQDPLQTLWQQIDQLLPEIAQQPERRGELLSLYREVLALDAENQRALDGLDEQRSNVLSEVQALIDVRELDQARAQLITVLAWFPDLEGQQTYTELQNAIATVKQVDELLVAAKQLLAEDKLLKPEGESAVDSYRSVLALDPENAEAEAGLAQVAERYRQLALSKQNTQAYSAALSLVSSGLSVAPDSAALKQLQKQLRAQYNKQQAIGKLLAEAASLEKQGATFKGSENAALRFLQVLKLDNRNNTARNGLKRVLTERVTAVEGLITAREFDQATAMVEEALAIQPEDERLLGLLLEIESSKPAIERLLLSGTPIESTYKDPKSSVAADRVLHIAFHYKNLADANTVFQALLFDGSRTLQIAAVPVVVSGAEGDTQFRIERPVEGFTEGGYHIDILLAGKRVYTQAFSIVR